MFDKINFKIPLDKFIENALYHPKKGYYSTKNPFGKEGDFITAPNISKVFSEMIFIWIISYWQKFYKNKEINIPKEQDNGVNDGNDMENDYTDFLKLVKETFNETK